jgi:hypothetical protein
MNAFQYWVIDSYIKHPNPYHHTFPREDAHNDPLLQSPRVSFTYVDNNDIEDSRKDLNPEDRSGA